MNWNNNNNGPWDSDGNNPWGGSSSKNRDLENSIKKAKEKFGKFKLGSPRNLSIFIIIALLIWLATGFYRVEPDEQGVELLFGKWNQTTTEPGLHFFFPTPIGKVMTPKVENVRKINVGYRSASDLGFGTGSNTERNVLEESLMLTGDQNIVDVHFTVLYKIKDAGGVPVVMNELNQNNLLNKDVMTVSGKTVDQNLKKVFREENEVIYGFKKPIKEKAGFLVLRSNFFDTAIMKMSVVNDEFIERYLSDPSNPNIFIAKAIVFDGPEDYHKNINNSDLNIDEKCILVMRGCGPIGYPGSAEVVNMQPPDELLKKGISSLPCIGDGRQSGTSESPSILNVSPEAAVGGGLAIINNGDEIKIDLNKKRVDLLLEDEVIRERLKNNNYKYPENQTPWQEISRKFTGQLSEGACLNLEESYFDIANSKGIPRDSH